MTSGWICSTASRSPRHAPGGDARGECGSHLRLFDPRWPELVHPVASAVDMPLAVPPERFHIMLDSKAPWVRVHAEPSDGMFPGYPDESLAERYQRHGLESDGISSGSVG